MKNLTIMKVVYWVDVSDSSGAGLPGCWLTWVLAYLGAGLPGCRLTWVPAYLGAVKQLFILSRAVFVL